MSRQPYLYLRRYSAHILAQRLRILDEHAYALWGVVPLRIHDAVCDRLVQELQVAVDLGRTRRPLRLGLPRLCEGGA